MNVQRKKMAILKSIRDQQLNNYFTQRRKQFQQRASEDRKVLGYLQQLYDQLPSSIMPFLQVLYQHRGLVSEFLYKEIRQFCSRMVGSQNVEWCYFVTAINTLLADNDNKQIIQSIVNESLLFVLESAEFQLKKTTNQIIQQQIMINLLQYCFRLGGYVKSLNMLQQAAMVNTLKILWDFEWSEEGEISLLNTSINILSINFDEDNIENISNQERKNVEITKKRLIKFIFYGQENEKRLQKILYKMVNLIYIQNLQLLVIYLRLLIIFTTISQEVDHFYPLLRHNILLIISSISMTYRNIKHKKYSKYVIIFNIRLLNNILVNDVNLTLQILNEISLCKFIDIYNQQFTSSQIQSEIAELFINLAHFVNDQQEIIRHLIDIDTTQLMIKALKIFNQTKDDTCLQESASVLFIFLDQNPIKVKQILRKNQSMLRHILQEQVSISDMLQDILENYVAKPESAL